MRDMEFVSSTGPNHGGLEERTITLRYRGPVCPFTPGQRLVVRDQYLEEQVLSRRLELDRIWSWGL